MEKSRISQYLKKKTLYIIMFVVAFFVINATGFSQAKKMKVSIGINIKVDTSKVRIYESKVLDENENIKTVFLKMHYGGYKVLNPKIIEDLTTSGANIISVDIVYTNYHNKGFQDELNKRRITELYFLLPDVFNQKMVKWRYVEQLGYATEQGATELFHGIVIKYLKVPYYTPLTKEAMFGDIKTKELTDTSLFDSFKKYIKFENELICVDLTGSMSPYYVQLFVWLFLQKNIKPINFAFFNDGNLTPDHLKKKGNVGGIYFCKTNSIDTIITCAYNCITGGFGGDSPENNIEAIIKGVKKYPESKDIVMLADNWADMRDYTLIHKIKKPVKVVVCGTNMGGYKSPVNPQYLDLAKKTKGSIFTIEEEIMDLFEKKEGEQITIGGTKYTLRGGRFKKNSI